MIMHYKIQVLKKYNPYSLIIDFDFNSLSLHNTFLLVIFFFSKQMIYFFIDMNASRKYFYLYYPLFKTHNK